jgi:D-xylose transport system ATP-binding protein
VLNLIERLRERGHGVIMVSHNMADVQAVADTVCVLRLGRNNGVFDVDEVSSEEIVVAITGASDNVVARRAGRGRRGAPSTPATPEEA